MKKRKSPGKKMMNSFLERKRELTFSKDFTEKDFEKDAKIFSRISLLLYPVEREDFANYYFFLKKSGKTEKEQVELLKAWLVPKLDKPHVKAMLLIMPRLFLELKRLIP